jgi:hypothetical protein
VHSYILQCDAGAPAGRVYRFRGAAGALEWPMDGGARLGACGIWNFLWRLGARSQDCTVDELPTPAGSILWAALDEGTDPSPLHRLRGWIAAGGYLVASGDACAWSDVLGWPRGSWTTVQPENPYAGLAWTLPQRRPELIAPVQWPFGVSATCPDEARFVGSVHAVQGERQTPDRAMLVALDAPALVLGQRYCFLNGHPFAAFQAWLQGQANLQPWLGWRHRLFWLDEWVSAVADALFTLGIIPKDLPRPAIAGLGATTVVLRHDVDHSRDLSYLEEENRRGIPGTFAILRDQNFGFWRDALTRHPAHESAFHYNTGRRAWIRELMGRAGGAGAAVLEPSPGAVSGHGLLRQINWARAHGIGVRSVHRHLTYLVYPEWIDGLDAVFNDGADVLGASSLFRAQVLRWGARGVDGVAGTLGEWPDPQFPSWLPFKLAHAAAGGRRLRGWEATSMMECEPELVDQLLTYRIPHLSQRVVTLGFHPAHAGGKTFHRNGSLASFIRVLDVVAASGADIQSSGDVFRSADAAIEAVSGQR